jgi:quercetin dioxygenase-like cupin family protein
MVRLVDLADAKRLSVDRFGSRGVDLIPLVISEYGVTAADVAYIEPGGILGRHAAPIEQLFVVMSGSGWVSGSDGVRYPRGPGQGAVWEPGEEHASGSDEGLTAVIVEAAEPSARGLIASPRP